MAESPKLHYGYSIGTQDTSTFGYLDPLADEATSSRPRFPGASSRATTAPLRQSRRAVGTGKHSSPRFPLKGSFKKDTDTGRGVDIDSDMIVEYLFMGSPTTSLHRFPSN